MKTPHKRKRGTTQTQWRHSFRLLPSVSSIRAYFQHMRLFTTLLFTNNSKRVVFSKVITLFIYSEKGEYLYKKQQLVQERQPSNNTLYINSNMHVIYNEITRLSDCLVSDWSELETVVFSFDKTEAPAKIKIPIKIKNFIFPFLF